MDDLEIDPALLEEVVNEAEQEASEPPSSLDGLALLMTQAIEDRSTIAPQGFRTLTLVEDGSYSVVAKSGLYTLRSLIGGEEFALHGVMTAKGGKDLIWVLKPLYVCDYALLHLPEADSKSVSGLVEWISDDLAPMLAKRAEIFKEQQAAAERAKIGSRVEYQEMGFGSW